MTHIPERGMRSTRDRVQLGYMNSNFRIAISSALQRTPGLTTVVWMIVVALALVLLYISVGHNYV